jgi:hypothetical protein
MKKVILLPIALVAVLFGYLRSKITGKPEVETYGS